MNARKNKKILLHFAPPPHTEVIVQFLPGEQKKKKRLNNDENAVACYLQKVSTYKQVEINKDMLVSSTSKPFVLEIRQCFLSVTKLFRFGEEKNSLIYRSAPVDIL